MAHFDTQFDPKRARRASLADRGAEPGKWSGRRTISVAIIVSTIMWAIIFYVAKAFVG